MGEISDFTDAQILAAISGGPDWMEGGRSNHILRRLVGDFAYPDNRTNQLYRRLCKMERAGLVLRSERYSSCNSIYWVAALQGEGE